jgi:hypothetical protein
VPSIRDTAYPRLKAIPSGEDLKRLFTPSRAERDFAKECCGDPALLTCFLVLMKTFRGWATLTGWQAPRDHPCQRLKRCGANQQFSVTEAARSDHSRVLTNLKADLKNLDMRYSALPDEVKVGGLFSFASYPPQDKNFLVTRLWHKRAPKWRQQEEEARGVGCGRCVLASQGPRGISAPVTKTTQQVK